MAISIPAADGLPSSGTTTSTQMYRVSSNLAPEFIHTDKVYNTLISAASAMEDKLAESLKNYQDHPDVQANLQQLQYDLQQWNLALTTMTNINKNMGDALSSIASNFR